MGISYYAPKVYERIQPFVGRYLNPSRPRSQMMWSEGIEYDNKR